MQNSPGHQDNKYYRVRAAEYHQALLQAPEGSRVYH
jgi:hypothetical protein